MNIRRLRRIAKIITQKSTQFDMAMWFQSNERCVAFEEATNGHNPQTHCGTVACIGGWACALYPQEARKMSQRQLFSTGEVASKLLELNDMQKGNLFFPEEWPDKWRMQYASRKTNQGRANVAAKYIEHFIACQGDVHNEGTC